MNYKPEQISISDVYTTKYSRPEARRPKLIHLVSLPAGSALPDTCAVCHHQPAAWRDLGYVPYRFSKGGLHFWLCDHCQECKVRLYERG